MHNEINGKHSKLYLQHATRRNVKKTEQNPHAAIRVFLDNREHFLKARISKSTIQANRISTVNEKNNQRTSILMFKIPYKEVKT